ncbi:MAG: phytase, partial [Melioribacteraceae bacterium]
MKAKVFKYAINLAVIIFVLLMHGCQKDVGVEKDQKNIIKPVVVTDSVKYDTDDPAIWINPSDPSKSLILGTDKDSDGALYVFDLN